MKKLVWHNGKFVKEGAARFPVLSHALHYGSSVFEGIRAYETANGPAVFRLRDHADRLFRSAAAFDMKIPYSKRTIEAAIKKTVVVNRLRSCYIRPIVFYGEGRMGLAPRGAKLHVVIAAWPWGAYLGEHKALSVCISPFVRFHPKSIVPGAKIGGYYATSVLATMDARRRGFDECILLDPDGSVAEGPGENIFIVKRGKLFTPLSPSILRGITRESIMAIARDLRIPVAEKKVSLKDLKSADEIFFAGTAVEIGTVRTVNGRRIGTGETGPVTEKIRSAYLAAVHGKLPRYRRWLSSVI